MVGVAVLGLRVAVDSGDAVGYDGRSVGGFAYYPARWYVVLGYTGVVTSVVLLICPVVL